MLEITVHQLFALVKKLTTARPPDFQTKRDSCDNDLVCFLEDGIEIPIDI